MNISSFFLLLSLALLFVGERIVGSGSGRIGADVAAIIAAGVALQFAVKRGKTDCCKGSFWYGVLVFVGCLVYAGTTPQALDTFGVSGEFAESYSLVLGALWPV